MLTTPNNSICLLKDSPSLYNKIKRLFNSVPEICEFSYSLAIKYKGNDEIGYIRDPDASYNPRAARIGVIFLEPYLKIKNEDLIPRPSPELISLAILSSTLLTCYKNEIIKEKILDELIENKSLADNYTSLYKDYIFTETRQEITNNINAIMLISLFIDRMRHFHIEKKMLSEIESEKLNVKIQLDAKYYLTLCEKFFPYYSAFINHFSKRN